MAVHKGNTPNQQGNGNQGHVPNNYGNPNAGQGNNQGQINPHVHTGQAPGSNATKDQSGDNPSIRRGMRGVNDRLRRSATSERSEKRVSEALNQMNTGIEECIRSQVIKGQAPDLYRFDRQQQNLLMSAILATKVYKVGNDVHIAVRALLLESSDAPLPKLQRNVGNGQEEIQMLAQDVYDERYWNRIEDFVREQAKAPNATVHDAGVLYIPEVSRIKDQSVGFDFTDIESVKELLVQTTNRLDDALSYEYGEEPLNLEGVKRDGERLRVSVDTGDDLQVYDTVGNPVRADMLLTMKLVSNDRDHGQQQGYLKEEELNRVAAFVDFEYTRPPQQTMQTPYGQQPPRPFTAMIIATQVRNASWVEAQTLELYILALSNLYRCLRQDAWAQTRNPKFTSGKTGKGVDTRDIGALAYMVTGKKVELAHNATSDEDYIMFLEQTVEPHPAFGIDIDLVGDNIAVERHFLMAAAGEQRRAAKDFIIAACDNLTNNHFSTFFDAANDIVVPLGTEVNLGRYPDANGEVRDPRDLDLVAALNLSKGNIEEFKRWYSTRLPSDGESYESAMRRRESIERNWLSPSLSITRRAPRLIFTQAFLDALDGACEAAGARVEMQDVIGLENNQFMGNTMIGQYRVAGQPRMGAGGGNQGGSNYSHTPNYHYPRGGNRY